MNGHEKHIFFAAYYWTMKLPSWLCLCKITPLQCMVFFTEKGKQIDENVQEFRSACGQSLKKPWLNIVFCGFVCISEPSPTCSQDLKGQIYSIKYPSDCWYVDLLRGFVCKLINFFGAHSLVPTPRWLLSSARAPRGDNWKHLLRHISPCQHPDFTPYLA